MRFLLWLRGSRAARDRHSHRLIGYGRSPGACLWERRCFSCLMRRSCFVSHSYIRR